MEGIPFMQSQFVTASTNATVIGGSQLPDKPTYCFSFDANQHAATTCNKKTIILEKFGPFLVQNVIPLQIVFDALSGFCMLFLRSYDLVKENQGPGAM
jgi:hypothetical protein